MPCCLLPTPRSRRRPWALGATSCIMRSTMRFFLLTKTPLPPGSAWAAVIAITLTFPPVSSNDDARPPRLQDADIVISNELTLPHRLEPVDDEEPRHLLKIFSLDPRDLIPVDMENVIQEFIDPKNLDEFKALVAAFKRLGEGRCREATRALLALTDDSSPLQAFGADAALDLLRYAAFQSYDAECLSSEIDGIPEEVRRVTGILEVSHPRHPKPFCTATLVGSDLIVTSRHCFIKSSGVRNAGCLGLRNPGIAVRFLDSSDETHRVDHPHIRCDSSDRPTGTDRDFVYATLARAVANADPAAVVPRSKQIPPGSLFWLVGFSDFAAKADQASGRTDPLAAVRYAPRDTCGVLYASGACLLHTCQTGMGVSGAGLLRIPEGSRPELLAVHAGPARLAANCGPDAPSSQLANVASRAIPPTSSR